VNKRFYPGGDNSIRGYQRGEAAPRAADGSFIGAKAYLLANLEIEQAMAPNWSIVAFGDALGIAPSLADYPFDERLYSAGLGVRYQTLIGPVRLEYGRNINPRPQDPSGTWHLSIGYPF
jgi:outer membrane translocation and assembly module TamA